MWQVAWAPPRFGTALASASMDGSVAVWREDPATKRWSLIHHHLCNSDGASGNLDIYNANFTRNIHARLFPNNLFTMQSTEWRGIRIAPAQSWQPLPAMAA